MRFRIVQDFAADADRVQEAYLDPAFLQAMGALPKLGAPELLSEERDGDVVRRRVRFHFAGDLNSAVRAVVDPAKLSWIEESTTNVTERRTSWTIRPDHYADNLASSGESRLEPTGASTSRRTTTGEVTVKVFLVGSKVEGAIISGMEEHAARERAALVAHLGVDPN